jgi:hypothetical protein
MDAVYLGEIVTSFSDKPTTELIGWAYSPSKKVFYRLITPYTQEPSIIVKEKRYSLLSTFTHAGETNTTILFAPLRIFASSMFTYKNAEDIHSNS